MVYFILKKEALVRTCGSEHPTNKATPAEQVYQPTSKGHKHQGCSSETLPDEGDITPLLDTVQHISRQSLVHCYQGWRLFQTELQPVYAAQGFNDKHHVFDISYPCVASLASTTWLEVPYSRFRFKLATIQLSPETAQYS